MEVTSDEEGNLFCVSWSNHHKCIGELFQQYFLDETYADCSLATKTKEFSAHKIILSVCSPFFNSILRRHREKHPVVILEHAEPEDIQAIIEYMYKGEVSVPQAQLPRFLTLADTLQIKGFLSNDDSFEVDSANYKRTCDEISKEEPIEQLEEDEVAEEGEEEHLEILQPEEYLMEDEEATAMFLEEPDAGFIKVGPPNSPIETKPPARPSPLQKRLKMKPKPEELNSDSQVRIKCAECGRFYKTEASFYNHHRYDCNNIHICTTCGKNFKNKRHLLDHVRDDCGRYHVCTKCNRHFTQKVNLTTHQKHYCKIGEYKMSKKDPLT